MEVVSSSKRQKKCSNDVEAIPESSMVASSSTENEVNPNNPDLDPLLSLCPNFMETYYYWPVSNDDDAPALPEPAQHAYYAVSQRLPVYEYEYYDRDILINNNDIATGTIDVVSLLTGGSGNDSMMHRNDDSRELLRVDESTFRGKHVLVCCFHLPIFRGAPDNLYLQPLATTCFELFSGRDDIEIVLVGKMDRLLDYEHFFTHFLKAFPSRCLVVPFEDSKRRDYICYCLHLRDSSTRMRCLLLDDNKGNKEERKVLFSGCPSFTYEYGADAFPYTDEKLKELDGHDFPLWKTASTSRLEGLLGCTPSDVLRKIGPTSGRMEITVSELKQHLVALLLCVQGDLIPWLRDLSREYRTKELSFEVVLVYLPVHSDRDPELFMSNTDMMLKQSNLSCWRLPFNNSVSRRLYRLAESPWYDEVIVVGPHDAFVEPYGEENARYDLIVDEYPFFGKEFVQLQLDKVKEHTLESLLVVHDHGSRNYVLRGHNRVAVSELLGRHVVLYYGSEPADESFKWYYEMKGNDPTFEVVYVRKNSTAVVEVADSDLLASMPWLVCPFDPAHSAFLEKEFFRDGIQLRESFVVFGQNGRICSLRATNHLTCDRPEGFSFDDSNLRSDVIRYLRLNFKSTRCLD